MYASDGETLILRPEGFKLDVAAAEAFLESLPGLYRYSDQAPWALVAPASDLPRLRVDPLAPPSRPGQPSFVLVWLSPHEVKIHPGLIPATFGRVQRLIGWLLELGAWRISGMDREFGIIRSLSELFCTVHADPDARLASTESPPRTGEPTTFRRYLGDPDTGDYYHEFVRVHDSGAFSYEEYTKQDRRCWEGRLAPEFVARWSLLANALDFQQTSPGDETEYKDRTALIVERSGQYREKPIDAARPPESFAELIRLMNGWGETLRAGKIPAELVDIRQIE